MEIENDLQNLKLPLKTLDSKSFSIVVQRGSMVPFFTFQIMLDQRGHHCTHVAGGLA